MTTTWDSVTAALAEGGWQARVVVAERLDDRRERVARTLNSGALPEPAASHLAEEVGFALPEGMATARSVVVGAMARPLTHTTLTVGDTERTVPVPPHYARYHTVPDQLTAVVTSALALSGHRGARLGRPAARRCRVGRAAAARALRALQRLPARLPHGSHPRRPLSAPHQALPDVGQRGPRPVPRLGRPDMAHLRRGLPALSTGLPRERGRRADRGAAGDVRRTGDHRHPRGRGAVRVRRSHARQTRALRPRLLPEPHRAQPHGAPPRMTTVLRAVNSAAAGQAGTITVRGSALARRTRPAARPEPQGKERG